MITFITKWILYIISRLIYLTCKIEYRGLQHTKTASKMGSKSSYLIATWHECLFAGIIGQKDIPICPLISRSKDGDLADFIIKKWGYTSIRGSSHRGSLYALKELQKKSNLNLALTLTVDGPRGPRRSCKRGIIELSKSAQIPIITAFPTANRQWVIKKSWDRFKIPKPFSKVVTYFGPPIMVSENLSKENFEIIKQKILSSLTNLENMATDERDYSQRL